LLSYAGQVWVGVQADAGLVPDPERIVAGFEDELAALRTASPARRIRGRKRLAVAIASRRSSVV
jgi:hypothetical protein